MRSFRRKHVGVWCARSRSGPVSSPELRAARAASVWPGRALCPCAAVQADAQGPAAVGSGDRSGDHHLHAADGDLREGSGLRRFGRPHAATTFDRRQGPAGPHIEDGPARHSLTADRRCRRRGAMGSAQRRARRLLACPKAEYAGRGCAGQPYGTHGLGAAAQGRGLQGSGDGGRIGWCRRVVAGCERGRGNVRADGQETGSGKPSFRTARL